MRPKAIKIKLLKLKPSIVAETARAIKSGGVIVFPSDTCYGLAADPTNKRAVKKLFAIKDRSWKKPVSLIFKNLTHINEWARLNTKQKKVLQKNLPGAFTFLLVPRMRDDDKKESEEGNCSAATTSRIGIRIPDHPFTRALSALLDMPYTATSANISGESPCYSIKSLMAQLKKKKGQAMPDLIIDAGELPHNKPSSVIDVVYEPPKIMRGEFTALKE